MVGHKWVNYWVHMEFLNDTTGKMSKSNGDFLTLSKLEEKGYAPIVYRYFLLMASYRKQINFSFELLDGAKNGYENLVRKIANAVRQAEENGDKVNEDVVSRWRKQLLLDVSNDLNTAGVIADFQKDVLQTCGNADIVAITEFVDEILGLRLIDNARALLGAKNQDVPQEIWDLVNKRSEAKKARDYALADEIRAEILRLGYVVKDTKDGVEVFKES